MHKTRSYHFRYGQNIVPDDGVLYDWWEAKRETISMAEANVNGREAAEKYQ